MLIGPPFLDGYDGHVITQDFVVGSDEPKPRIWMNIDSRSETDF